MPGNESVNGSVSQSVSRLYGDYRSKKEVVSE